MKGEHDAREMRYRSPIIRATMKLSIIFAKADNGAPVSHYPCEICPSNEDMNEALSNEPCVYVYIYIYIIA